MKNLFIKLAVISGLVFSTITLAAEDLKVMYIGTPQVGPPIILTQAYAQNLTIPNTFISMKDCASALRAVEQNENVAFFISDMTTMSHQHRGEDCVPKFKPEDIVGTMATSWHLCRKPNGKNLSTGRIAIGVASVLPGPGIIRDFNKQNGLNTVNVSLSNERVATSQLSSLKLNSLKVGLLPFLFLFNLAFLMSFSSSACSSSPLSSNIFSIFFFFSAVIKPTNF